MEKRLSEATSALKLVLEASGKPPNPAKPDTEAAKEAAAQLQQDREMRETVEKILGKEITKDNVKKAQDELAKIAQDAKAAELKNLKESDLIARVTRGDAQISQMKVKLANAKGQLESARKLLAQGGKGVQAVPCWPTLEGNPEYIFDVALTSKGLIVRDRKLPHRQAEQKALPIDEIVFDTELSPSRFEQLTKRLFDWSVQHECRHFVRAFDQTGVTEKMTYKAHLQSVGARFYYREELREQF